MSRFIIYALHRNDSQRIYVGKSTRGLARPKEHIRGAKYHPNYPLSRWIKKHGTYEIAVLEELESYDHLDAAERFHIAAFRAAGVPLLNLTDGGEGIFNPSDSVRQKISATHKGTKWTEERKKKLSDAITNLSPEVKQKVAAAIRKVHLGAKRSPATCQKLSAVKKADVKNTERLQQRNRAQKGVSLNLSAEQLQVRAEITRKYNLRRGGHSEETKVKISKALLGRKNSPESYRRGGLTRVGLKQSEETKQKKSIALRGRQFNTETRLKMSGAQKLLAAKRGSEYYAKLRNSYPPPLTKMRFNLFAAVSL